MCRYQLYMLVYLVLARFKNAFVCCHLHYCDIKNTYLTKKKANNCQLTLQFLCPRHDNGRGIKCYPCPSVRTLILYVGTLLRTYVRPGRRLLSNSNIFYQNFMKLGHIVKYHDVFFNFDNGPYRTRLSRVMALCL